MLAAVKLVTLEISDAFLMRMVCKRREGLKGGYFLLSEGHENLD